MSIKELISNLVPWCMISAVFFQCKCFAAEEPWSNFSSSQIKISHPSNWKPTATRVKAVKLEHSDEKPDGVAPAHEEIVFQPSKTTIYVFPTHEQKLSKDDFKKAYPTVVSAVTDLRKQLAANKDDKGETPILPWMDASTPFEAKKSRVKFANGEAIRYIGEYLIEPDVIDNERLTYCAQGLSSDGNYFISVMAPISTKSLPVKSDISKWPDAKYKKFSVEFKAYADKVGAKLEALSPDSFTPSLATLDRLVKSITITK